MSLSSYERPPWRPGPAGLTGGEPPGHTARP
jgi:hypothetical protein